MHTTTILVVGNDVETTERIGSVLARAGFLVETAATSRRAVKRLKAFTPEFLIADLRLPARESVALAHAIISDASLSHVRIIGVVGDAGDERPGFGLASLCEALLSPRIESAAFLDRLKAIVRSRPAATQATLARWGLG